MVLMRSVTWNVLRHILHDVKQLRRMCAVTSLHKEKGQWLPLLKKENILELEKIWKSQIQKENENRLQAQPHMEEKEKFYVLSMFPYPSGKLHMGHVRVYTISDTMARYHRMLGHDVIHPMGWDAFGLPAENAARERNLHPKQWTYSNISTMRKQLMNLGCSFDWNREVTTCDPSYYKWTQYIFVKLYEAGLTYQKHASVHWDPVDQTVLAAEQIDENGRSWRSGALAEKKYLKQWYIKTTVFSKEMYDGLDNVDKALWEDVVNLQRAWIGVCNGTRFYFTVMNEGVEMPDKLSIFTDSPECIYGISHLTVDTSHILNDQFFYKEIRKHPVTGKDVILLSVQAVHPFTGQPVPVMVSEVVKEQVRSPITTLGIPCVSEEEKVIAELFDLPWQQVLSNNTAEETLVNSDQFDGLDRVAAKESVMATAREQGCGGHPGSKLLEDWLISRQRYWGTPIPMIHCDTCQTVPVPYEDLPVVLPDDIDVSDMRGGSPLQKHEEWSNVTCPKCGGAAKRETDTMDTFVDSSWYFLRYIDPNNEVEPISKTLANRYMPVDLYIGGKEHAQLHLYFARFFNYFLHHQGVVDHKEPFVDLLTQGMVKGESFRVRKTGQYIHPSEAVKTGNKYVKKDTNEPLEVKFEKMSKSKLNGIDPEELFEAYGVDQTRLCILSNVAPKSDRNWNTTVYDGVQKWLNRFWYLVGVLVNRSSVTSTASAEDVEAWDQNIRQLRNKCLAEVDQHINSTFTLNVVISRLQGFTSALRKVPAEVAVSSSEYERAVCDVTLIMAPLAPMFAAELWNGLSEVVLNRDNYDFSKSVHEQTWPKLDPDANMGVCIYCNHEEIGQVYIQQQDVSSQTADSILSLAIKEDFYHSAIQNYPVSSVNLKSKHTGFLALNITVPDLVKVMKEKKVDTKKKKKEKKEKKGKEAFQVDSP